MRVARIRNASSMLVAVDAAAALTGGAAGKQVHPTGTVFPMRGFMVVPGPGDPQAMADGSVRWETDKDGILCFGVHLASGMSEPFTAGHIHRGDPGEAGPVAVELFSTPRTTFELDRGECIAVDPKIEHEIARMLGDFCLDLHNDEFSDGAIRGQLDG